MVRDDDFRKMGNIIVDDDFILGGRQFNSENIFGSWRISSIYD